MSLLLSMFLPFVVCLGMALVTSMYWWKDLSSPWLFGAIVFLCTMGLYRLLQAINEFGKLFVGRSYFLESSNPLSAVQIAQESLNTETVVLCVLLVVIGGPLLFGLRTAMVKL
jgi:hypothetical protein